MDVEVAATLGGSAAVAAKLLGPTAEYLGDGIRDWTQRRAENLGRVFENAGRKVGQEALNRPGAVPPRVLKGVLEEGQFADDELMAEYLGGVLATSRSETGRDDRAASLNGTISRLSTYALRLHFILYAHAQRIHAGSGVDLRLGRDAGTRVYLPTGPIVAGFEFSPSEVEQANTIFNHAMSALSREDLIRQWLYGDQAFLRSQVRNLAFPAHGVVYQPAPLGMELFCAAHGVRDDYIDAFTGDSSAFRLDTSIPIPPGARFIRDLEPHQSDDDAGTIVQPAN